MHFGIDKMRGGIKERVVMGKVRGKETRRMLTAAIREAAKACGGRPFTRKWFISRSKFRYRAIYDLYPSWTEALRAAGMEWSARSREAPLEELAEEWGKCARKLGRVPTQKEFGRVCGRRRPQTITRRCAPWNGLPNFFRKFAAGKEEWEDVVGLLPPRGHQGVCSRFGRRAGVDGPGPRGLVDERLYGPPLDFRNLRHAPMNEMGVVWLFGVVSGELGFVIESIQGAFPDCVAKREIGKDEWQVKRIEFEYESRNFRDHGHPSEGCDLIVCWVHNWPECPANIEVIALRDVIAAM